MALSAPAALRMDTIAQVMKRAEGSHFFCFRYIGRCMRESLVPLMLFSKLSRGSVQRELSLDIRSQNQFLDYFSPKNHHHMETWFLSYHYKTIVNPQIEVVSGASRQGALQWHHPNKNPPRLNAGTLLPQWLCNHSKSFNTTCQIRPFERCLGFRCLRGSG